MKPRILLSYVHMGGTERDWVEKAFESEWIVPLGPNVDEFEHRLEKYLGAPNVVALSAGTAAIHLALVALGVGSGDEVICQSFTFAASANPIKYQGADPVFVDSEPDTWNMSPDALEEAIIDRKKQTGHYPKAIIPVYLYGMPAKMDEIRAIADKYGIPIVEDSAEARLGIQRQEMRNSRQLRMLEFQRKQNYHHIGRWCFGVSLKRGSRPREIYATQAREQRPYYYHETIGYNYRLSNVSAGIGCGQMDVLQPHVELRRAIHDFYTKELAEIDGLSVQQNPSTDFNSNFWLSTVLIDPKPEKTRNLCGSSCSTPVWKRAVCGGLCTCSPFSPTRPTMATQRARRCLTEVYACRAVQALKKRSCAMWQTKSKSFSTNS